MQFLFSYKKRHFKSSETITWLWFEVVSTKIQLRQKPHSFLVHAVYGVTIPQDSQFILYTVRITLVNMSCSRDKNETCEKQLCVAWRRHNWLHLPFIPVISGQFYFYGHYDIRQCFVIKSNSSCFKKDAGEWQFLDVCNFVNAGSISKVNLSALESDFREFWSP